MERWLPFKFRRKNTEEKKAAQSGESTAMTPFSSVFGAPMAQWMQTAFNDPFFKDAFPRFGEMDRWFGDFSPTRFSPSLDVVDEEGAVRVSAELPGLSKDDIRLEVRDDTLLLRGEKKNEEESRENGAFRTERYYGFFERSVPLPSNVDHAKAEANFDKGVLTIRFPKVSDGDSSSRKIPISG